ncbi:hypothetical protein [Vibrio sp. D431a]|uniref:hypothetical protein n=1 Tax=Vibrio sp. D431a TaxID=2837388 RepID=UPI0025554F22|nr:hypothetical protein [Vibrio sp. D431a]MDK9790036.1 hypothetical protein [Vibrio sp. D431a]
MLTRDEEIIAMALFGRGTEEVSFANAEKIHSRSKAALDGLVDKQAITVSKSGNSLYYKACKDVIGRPLSDFKPQTKEEDFPLTLGNY